MFVILECHEGQYHLTHHAVPYDDAPLAAAFPERNVPDRERLVRALSRGAQRAGREMDVLLQVALSEGEGRGGAAPEALDHSGELWLDRQIRSDVRVPGTHTSDLDRARLWAKVAQQAHSGAAG